MADNGRGFAATMKTEMKKVSIIHVGLSPVEKG